MSTKFKFCSKCQKRLSSKRFWKSLSKNGLQTWCKSCMKLHRKKTKNLKIKRKQVKERWILSFLETHPCVDCGEKDPIVLEFDHVRGQKIVQVSELRNREYSLERVKEEIAKCDVRCANCHRRKTAAQLGWHKESISS